MITEVNLREIFFLDLVSKKKHNKGVSYTNKFLICWYYSKSKSVTNEIACYGLFVKVYIIYFELIVTYAFANRPLCLFLNSIDFTDSVFFSSYSKPSG